MQKETRVYLDSNAGAPLHRSVKEALLLFFSDPDRSANPSSPHTEGKFSRKIINESREKVAKSIQASPSEITFTSSGSEANQLVIRSVLSQSKNTPWLLSSAEHDSVWKLAKEYETRVSWLEISRQGLWKRWDESLQAPSLISLLWVNNESGVINPLKETIREFRKYFPHVLIHVDAIQAWGKLPIDVRDLNADFLSLSGHKIGALAGIGALWARNPRHIHAQIVGSQELAKRGGTENLAGILSMGVAASQINPTRWIEILGPRQTLLETLIGEHLPTAQILGEDAPRVAHTTEIIVPGTKNNDLVVALDIEGFSVSSGAACSSGIAAPSRVALAMGYPESEASSVIRISLHEGITDSQIRDFVQTLKRCAERLKRD